jgi:hypothetical protein
MPITIEETRADLQMRQVAPDVIARLTARLREDGGLFIVCPKCGRRRNFTHLLASVSDWENLIPLLESSWCEPCVMADIVENLNVVCVLTRHPGEPLEKEEVTHYGFPASRKRKRRF